MQARNKPVVLLVAEVATLRHFAWIVALANVLDMIANPMLPMLTGFVRHAHAS